MSSLSQFKIISTGINFPAPYALAKLAKQGAQVTKIEPPSGDPLKDAYPDVYQELTAGQQVKTIDLKQESGRKQLHQELKVAQILVTSQRPQALEKLGLSWTKLSQQHPHLTMISLVGYLPPNENKPGHDLTFQAEQGLLSPPHMPKSLFADIAAAIALEGTVYRHALMRQNGSSPTHEYVAIDHAANDLSFPLRKGMTEKSDILGGAWPTYGIYPLSDGWLAMAAIESHFEKKVAAYIGDDPSLWARALKKNEAPGGTRLDIGQRHTGKSMELVGHQFRTGLYFFQLYNVSVFTNL